MLSLYCPQVIVAADRHWDLLKYFDENYDEFGPKGLLDIDDHSGHITVRAADCVCMLCCGLCV